MPRAPQYQPGQFDSPRITGDRFAAANDGGGAVMAVAEGLSNLGRGLASFAEAEDAIQAHYDETQARRLALEYEREAQPIITEYLSLRGENAISAMPATRQKISELKDRYLSQASNPRMSDLLDQRVSRLAVNADTRVSEWSIQQQVKMDEETTAAEIGLAKERAAAAYFDPTEQASHIVEAAEAQDRLAKLNGWSSERAAIEKTAMLSDIHAKTITAMLNEAVPNVELAQAYFEANQDEMTATDRNAALARLKGPLELREAAAGFAEVASGTLQPGAEVEGAQKPVEGTVTSTFADHQRRGSAGYDIAAPAGSSILPIADGVVEEVGTGATGGNYVRIRHADGTLSSYMHMQHPTTLQQGQRVTRGTVIGTVGSTGRATGPHLHLEVKDASGKQVDPEGYLNGANPVGLPSDARNWNMASVMAGIDQKVASGEWSFEKGELVREYARRRMADDEALLRDRENDADRAASEWIIAQGSKFTDISQMPEHIRNALHPDDIAKWMNVADNNKNPTTEANGATATMLDLMRFYEPQRFADLNLGEFAGQVTDGEMNTLLQQQAKARQEAREWSPRSGIVTALNYQSTLDGAKYNDRDKAAILKLMEDFALRRFRDNGGKPLTESDYREAYRYATQETTMRSTFLPSVFGDTFTMRSTTERFNVEGTVNRAEQRTQVVERFRQRYGRAPTEPEIEFLLQRTSE